jgi:hypothetical protein
VTGRVLVEQRVVEERPRLADGTEVPLIRNEEWQLA